MVFPSDVLADEDNDDDSNFKQSIAAAKAKFLKNPKRNTLSPRSANHSNYSDSTGFQSSHKNGGQNTVDSGAFSGRATQRRRDATASRQFRSDVYGPTASPLSAAKSDSRSSPWPRRSQASGGFSVPLPVASLAKRLLDAQQKPMAGPSQSVLDKFKLSAEQSHYAPPGAFGDKYRRRKNQSDSIEMPPNNTYTIPEPSVIPPPPPSMFTPPTIAREETKYYSQNIRERKPLRLNDYNSRFGDEIIREEKTDPLKNPPQTQRKNHDDVSKAEKRKLLKDHFHTRSHMDAILKEMQASGNLMSRNYAVSCDTKSSRKRSQAAQRYDDIQLEKYGGDGKDGKIEVDGEPLVKKVKDVEEVAEGNAVDIVVGEPENEQHAVSNKSLLLRRQQSKKLKKQRKRTTEDQQEKEAKENVPKSARVLTKPPVALDCEFVGVGRNGVDDALARVSVVNEIGDVLYNVFVRPQEPVTDYRTEVSGVHPHDVSKKNAAAVEFDQAQREIAELIAGRVIVGHAITNDLKALRLSHPRYYIRDTQTYMPFKELGGASRPSLRKLAKAVLELDIHGGEHDSIEDARIAMQLYMSRRSEWERKLLHGEAKHYGKKRKRQEEFNWRHGSKRLERRMPRDEFGVRQRGISRTGKNKTVANGSADDGALVMGVTSGTALDR